MPFSARTRATIRNAAVTLTATIAVLGIADTASAATSNQAHSKTATSQAATFTSAMVIPECGSYGTGF